jgi:hypothetical protein
MRNSFVNAFALVLFFLSYGCSRKAPPPSPELTGLAVRVGEGLGNVNFGDTEQGVIEKFGAPDSKQGRALKYVRGGFEVYLSREGQRVTMFACGSTAPENAGRFKGKTAEGIGVGSSLADVQAAFGTPTSTRKKEDGNRAYEELLYKDRRLKVTLSEGKVLLLVWGNENNAMFK